MKIAALAGGVGGAKLADGLAMLLPAADLTVIVNTGDDFQHWGLKVCPDLDTVCYTLAGIANPQTGWGRIDESWIVLEQVKRLGGSGWFNIGDRDLATHIRRSELLQQGLKLSEVTTKFCQNWGVEVKVIPMTDDCVATVVHTKSGEKLAFQEYFVHQQCNPEVSGFSFEGIERAQPAHGVLEAIKTADVVVFCPSNPWVSIQPILSLPGISEEIIRKRVLAVSPIVGGAAIKGPAAKMYRELGFTPSAMAVAETYKGYISSFVIDNCDSSQASQINAWGIMTLVTDTIMKDRSDRKRLAGEILQFLMSMP